MERTIDVIDILDGQKIVVIYDIIFKKRQYVEWKGVKAKANAVQGIPEMIEIATLQFRYMIMMEKWTITMCFMQPY